MKYSFWAIMILMFSCSPGEFRTPEELQLFVADEDNGLKKTTEINGYKIEVMNRPTDLWVHQEVEFPDSSAITALRKKYDAYYYFIVSLSRDSKEALHQVSSMEQYSELVQTLSFRMADYVTLTTSAYDTIPVGDSMLNRTYGLSASTDIVFVFNKEKASGQEWVQFNLNEFGLGVGNQRFRFRRKDLDKVPPLKFQTIQTLN